ncbi:MAG: flippase [Nanoarchaeota archaeon]|mgnify:CR=1 FL=1
MVNYVGKILRGSGLMFAMTFIAALFSYGTRVMVARKLGPEQYGLFAAVFTFIMFFLFFRDLGLGTALVHFIAKARVQERYNDIKTAIVSVFLMQFLSSTIVGILIIIFSGYLSVHYFKVPESKTILLILVLYTMTSFLYTSISKALLNAFQKNVIYSLLEPAKNLFILLFTLLLFHYDYGIMAAAIPYAFVCIILFFVFQPFVQKEISFFKHKVENFKGITKELFSFGLPLMAADIGGKVIGYTNTLLLTYFVSLTEVGIYNVVLPSALFFIQISRAISAIVFPISTELHYKKDTKRLAKGLSLLYSYCFALIIPLIFTLFAFAGFFLDLFFGADYVSGALAFKILLVGSMFFILASVNTIIISSMGEPKEATKIILVSAVLNVALNLILIPIYSINGAAVATALAYLSSLILSTRKLLKTLNVPAPFLLWGKLLLVSSVFVMTVLYVTEKLHIYIYLEITLSVIIATLIYVLLLYLFNIIDFRDLKNNLMKAFMR